VQGQCDSAAGCAKTDLSSSIATTAVCWHQLQHSSGRLGVLGQVAVLKKAY
jgi:hypothetical protein